MLVLASVFDPIRRAFAHPQWAWIGLWIGLAFLIVALIVMIRTSWGQSHPLRKCAALSLLVHLLLACYATTIQIVSATGGGHRGGVNLLFIDGYAEGAPDGIDDPSAAATDVSVNAALHGDQEPGGNVIDPHPNRIVPPPLLTSTVPPAPEPADTKPAPPPESAMKPGADLADHQTEPEPPAAAPKEPSPTTADASKPDDRSAEPLPPISDTAPLATIPDTPTTSQPGDWMSGAPAGGELPLQSAAAGPSNDPPAPATPDASPDIAKDAHQPSADAETRVSAAQPVAASTVAAVASPALPEIYSDRVAPNRGEIARLRGGSPEGESAVQSALRWLSANQSADGHWDAAKFGAHQDLAAPPNARQGAGGAGSKADSAMTGLALLAFLGAGNTHVHGDYAKSVQHGLEYLLSIQARDGNLAGGAETYAYMYAHGMATLAMSEAYAMTGDKRLEAAVQSAINYTLSAQIKSTGGWRYRAVESPGERGDTSQLGWQLMSLKSAELAGVNVPSSAADGAVRFLKSVASGQNGGRASYRPGERATVTMTAEALVCRQFLGMTRDNPATNEAGDYLLSQLPSPEKINLYYWYYGTLGMYQLQDDRWQRWNEALQNTLVGRQRIDGDLAGSWDPECVWGGYGGRVYSTALSALCLEVYYRYLPIYRVAGRR
jgi:hypothetical protein